MTLDLEPGERIVRLSRRHWLVFTAGLLPYAILAALPFAVAAFLGSLPAAAAWRGAVTPSDLAGLGALWLLIVWTNAWGAFTLYFLNAWVLTDRRIIEIKQRGFFNREVSSLMLERVQDVSTDVSGLLSSLLDIGEIVVQSAGTVDKFRMHGIPDPEAMRNLILQNVAALHGTGDGVAA